MSEEPSTGPAAILAGWHGDTRFYYSLQELFAAFPGIFRGLDSQSASAMSDARERVRNVNEHGRQMETFIFEEQPWLHGESL